VLVRASGSADCVIFLREKMFSDYFITVFAALDCLRMRGCHWNHDVVNVFFVVLLDPAGERMWLKFSRAFFSFSSYAHEGRHSVWRIVFRRRVLLGAVILPQGRSLLCRGGTRKRMALYFRCA